MQHQDLYETKSSLILQPGPLEFVNRQIESREVNRRAGAMLHPGLIALLAAMQSGNLARMGNTAVMDHTRWLMHERPVDPDLVYKTGTQA